MRFVWHVSLPCVTPKETRRQRPFDYEGFRLIRKPKGGRRWE